MTVAVQSGADASPRSCTGIVLSTGRSEAETLVNPYVGTSPDFETGVAPLPRHLPFTGRKPEVSIPMPTGTRPLPTGPESHSVQLPLCDVRSGWWASNPRPPAPEAGALPDCATSRKYF